MHSNADDARGLSAAAQGREIAAGRLDPVALAEAYFAAIDAHPASGLVYARLTRTRALGEAAAARERARSGKTLGPLDGVPVSWKDLIDTAGTATEAGTRLLAGRTPTQDAGVLVNAGAAGSVCLGKTHLSEVAFSGLGVNPMAATPPNRNGAHLAPGGSSSGAAASLAFGLAPLAIGSDTGGSVRIPAAWNGLVGLKTTFGLVSNDGTVALSPSLDTIGPLARTVEDAALALGLLTRDNAPDLGDTTPADVRLFVAESVVMDGVEALIASAFDGALSRLSAAGSTITHGPVPAFTKAEEAARRLSFIVNAEAWQVWGGALAEKPDTVFPYIETRIRTGESVGAERLAEALATFAALRDEAAAFIAEHGLLVMPTVPIVAPPVARLLADEAFYTERNLMALRNTRMANLLGLSALTLPTGTPMAGLMLVGPPMGEAALLAAGRAIEAVLS